MAVAERYDRTTIAFHWLVAVVVVGQWVAGLTLDLLPKGPLKHGLWSTHVVFGFALTLVLVLRVAWRRTAGRHLPAVGPNAMRRTATIVHTCLYVMLFVVVSLGIANAFNRGFDLYGLVKLPQIGDKNLKDTITDLHGIAANLLIILAFGHALAALLHHYVWKDTVLGRMIPAAARSD